MGAIAQAGGKKTRRHYRKRMPFKKRYARKVFASRVKKIIKGYAEHKYTQSHSFSTSCQYDGLSGRPMVLMNNIPQGDLVTSRTGNRIEINSIQLRWTGWASSQIPDEQSFIFAAIVVDLRQENGVIPAFDDIWDNDTGATNPDENSQLLLDNRGRFKVLYHEVVPVSAYGTGPVVRDIYLRPKKLQSWYTGGLGTIDKNGIYLMFSSNRSAVGNPPYCSYQYRVMFTDV